MRFLAVGLAVLIVAWAVVNLAFEGVGFTLPGSKAVVEGVNAAATISKAFAALVLFLLSVDRERWRLRWVAGGLAIIALGNSVSAFLVPLFYGSPDPNAQLYSNMVRWTILCALFAVGLVLNTPPRFSPRWILVVLAVFVALDAFAIEGVALLPPLVEPEIMQAYAASSDGSLPGLTGWWWALSSLPLVLAIVAMVGALRLNYK